MGTLFNQSPRAYCKVEISDIDNFLENAVRLAEKYHINVSDVIAAKSALEQEISNNLYVKNGDTFDEQMAGFGELIEELNRVMEPD